MIFSIKPKQVPSLIWTLFTLLAIFTFVVWRVIAQRPSFLRPVAVPSESNNEQGDMPHIAWAARALASLKLRDSENSELVESSNPIIATALSEKRDAPDLNAVTPITAPFSLIIVETPRGIVAVLNGRTLRIGSTTSEGEVVQRIARSFVIVKLASGETRRIDMKDRFMPRSSLLQQENSK